MAPTRCNCKFGSTDVHVLWIHSNWHLIACDHQLPITNDAVLAGAFGSEGAFSELSNDNMSTEGAGGLDTVAGQLAELTGPFSSGGMLQVRAGFRRKLQQGRMMDLAALI